MIPKFRAWDKKHNEMIRVVSINFDEKFVRGLTVVESNLDMESSYNFEDVELLQSTGIKDKNGVEIFEGDIAKDINEELGYIAFLKQEMGYVIVYKNRDRRLGHRNGIDDFHLKTIGNIYEHPHLLKE